MCSFTDLEFLNLLVHSRLINPSQLLPFPNTLKQKRKLALSHNKPVLWRGIASISVYSLTAAPDSWSYRDRQDNPAGC